MHITLPDSCRITILIFFTHSKLLLMLLAHCMRLQRQSSFTWISCALLPGGKLCEAACNFEQTPA